MTHRWSGVCAVVLSLVILFVWIPLDVETGIIEKVRRQQQLGDAFAPFVASLLIGLGGVLMLFEKPPANKSKTTDTAVRQTAGGDIAHALLVLSLVAIALLLMRYVGPLAVSLLHADGAEYRLLRDTVPWKYLGFVAGGVWLILSLIVLVERRLRVTHVLIAVLVVALLIILYDLPFDTLLLPPNGDV